MSTVFIAYIPVLHQGYESVLDGLDPNTEIYLCTSEQLHANRSLAKDVRGLDPARMVQALRALYPGRTIDLLSSAHIEAISAKHKAITTPLDEVVTPLITTLFPQNKITTVSVFLRWDKRRSTSRTEVTPHDRISHAQFDRTIMSHARELTAQSSDWWRQVACVLVSAEGKILLSSRNRHLPQDTQQYADGDPRADFQSGESIEITSSIHAEAQLIATAAKNGVITAGCSLYVTTFPCPVCAKQIAESGIIKVYFEDGYSLVDAQSVLQAKGVEIIQVADSAR